MIETLKKEADRIAKKHSLRLFALFGSSSTGETHGKSDVDFAVLGSHPLSNEELFWIAEDLAEALKRPDIDIIDMYIASPLLLMNVSRQGILLYEAQSGLWIQSRVLAFKKFIDTKPLYEKYYERMKSTVS